MENQDIYTLNNLAFEVNHAAREKGWWDGGDRNFGELLALVHSEVSEALEEYRNGHDFWDTYCREDGKPEGIPSELADVIIRVLDICGEYGINIGAAVANKLEFNKSRPYRHGGKTA